jgi:hypothetical protein
MVKCGLLEVTVVATERPVTAVIGQAGVTVGTFGDMATIKAHQYRCIAPAVDVYQYLLASGERLPDGVCGGA